MHNLSMAHHAAGKEDEAVKLQEEIARIGDEMGMTAEEQSEAGTAADGAAPGGGGAVELSRGGGGKAAGKKGREEGDSAQTWKPMHTRSKRKGRRRK